MGYTDKALQAHVASTLHQIFHGFSDKLADIDADTVVAQYLTLAEMGLPDNVVCLLLSATVTVGAGFLDVWPMEDVYNLRIGPAVHDPQVVCAIINNRLKFNQTVATDEFMLFCQGYWTEGQVRG